MVLLGIKSSTKLCYFRPVQVEVGMMRLKGLEEFFDFHLSHLLLWLFRLTLLFFCRMLPILLQPQLLFPNIQFLFLKLELAHFQLLIGAGLHGVDHRRNVIRWLVTGDLIDTRVHVPGFFVPRHSKPWPAWKAQL